MERKFERKTEQTTPTNPKGDLKKPKTSKKSGLASDTIKEQQNKK